MLSKEEREFLLTLLSQINVQCIQADALETVRLVQLICKKLKQQGQEE